MSNMGRGYFHQRNFEEELQEAFFRGLQQGREEGYQNGYDDGDKNGFFQGREQGFQDGFDEGEQQGFQDGYNKCKSDLDDEINQAYEQGSKDGYEKGYDAGYEKCTEEFNNSSFTFYMQTAERADASTMTETSTITTANAETMTESITFCVTTKDTDIEPSTSISLSDIKTASQSSLSPAPPSDYDIAVTANLPSTTTPEILSPPDIAPTNDDRPNILRDVISPSPDFVRAGDLRQPFGCTIFLPKSPMYQQSIDNSKPTPGVHINPESTYYSSDETSWPPFGPDTSDTLDSLSAILGPAPRNGHVPDTFRGGGVQHMLRLSLAISSLREHVAPTAFVIATQPRHVCSIPIISSSSSLHQALHAAA